MIKRILVALSGTPYTPSAVQHAITLAKQHDAEITGVTIADMDRVSYVGSIPIGAYTAAHELVEHREMLTNEAVDKAIASFEDVCAKADVKHTVVREAGSPFEELVSLWRYHDLTIMGLRGMFEYGVVHHPDDYLIQLIKTGVRPMLAVAETYRPINKVLIAYSGSMESAKAMKRFVQMSYWGTKPTIRIVSMDRHAEDANRLLDEASRYCRAHGMQVDTQHIEDSPRTALLPAAEAWDADMIVMGSTARARIIKYVLGDVVLNAIRNATIPLFLTR